VIRAPKAVSVLCFALALSGPVVAEADQSANRVDCDTWRRTGETFKYFEVKLARISTACAGRTSGQTIFLDQDSSTT
jgi:hypothetical protein